MTRRKSATNQGRIEEERLLRPLVAVAVAIVVTWAGFAVYMLLVNRNYARANDLGGAFGVLNALFSGLGLIAVTAALLLQLRESRHSQQIHNEGVKMTLLGNSSAHMGTLEKGIGEIPTILRFYGISDEELSLYGITATEFGFLLASFTFGSTYYRVLTPDDPSAFEPGTYRYKICSSPDTRRVWPLIRTCMMPSNYREKVDATVALFERGPGAIPTVVGDPPPRRSSRERARE